MSLEKKIIKQFEEDDPMELVGVEYTLHNFDTVIEGIIEEYIKLGFDENKIIWLFKNPFFKMTNSIYKQKGEQYIKRVIERIKKRWLADDY
ncbi:MAG: hypothetical protein ACK4NF_05205 [Planctomycetota bacterium]